MNKNTPDMCVKDQRNTTDAEKAAKYIQ